MTLDMVTVDSNTASGPLATHGGGGIFNNGGTLMVNNSTISNNVSQGEFSSGGGIHVKAGSATVMLSTISGNLSTNAGGLFNMSITTINATTIANNTALTSGGGVVNSTGTTSIKNNDHC